ADGELGIYPAHVPLVTPVTPGEVRIIDNGKETEMVIGSGFAEITGDAVEILTDSAQEDSQIDAKASEEAMERARKLLEDKNLEAEEVAEAEATVLRLEAALRFKRRRQTRSS
ncbi:MAG: ATP synthase F1 subunit epsilon, partial [Verrucomicrobia bacterium]|nr:ATP synthase F1 subunit epsilon [Verrucomicrobiota bacterium]